MTYNVFSGTLNPTHSLTIVWRLGLVVARWSRSTKLLYAGPG